MPPVPAPSGSWHCTFDDEFNGSSLDTSKWSVQTTAASGYTTGDLWNMVCYVNDPRTVSESGGYLDLSVVEAQDPSNCSGDYPAIGGMVMSQHLFSQDYGFFEASAEMPATSVPGLQDTLWLYPENLTYGAWPNSGEIDFGQWYSNYSNNDFPDIIYPGWQSDPNASNNYCSISGVTPAGQFNTYALLWTPTTLTVYYDGMACLTDRYGPYVTSPDTAPEPFNQPFFLTLTAAMGNVNGDDYQPGNTPMPATMKVDWVRAWQYGS